MDYREIVLKDLTDRPWTRETIEGVDYVDEAVDVTIDESTPVTVEHRFAFIVTHESGARRRVSFVVDGDGNVLRKHVEGLPL